MLLKRILLSLLCQILSFSTLAKIQYDNSVKRLHQETLNTDLEFFKKLDLQSDDTILLPDLFGVKRFTNDDLIQWLEARVSYIMGDIRLDQLEFEILQTEYPYPEPNRLPELEEPTADIQDDSRAITVMKNIGTPLYIAGKTQRELYGVKVAGQIRIVSSPRVGILQIGPGLFHPEYQIDPKKPDAPANRINRLRYLFHEARHSDGHGFTLGFLHAVCPIGHTLAGLLACDRNRNGPYTIAASFIREIMKSCDSCRSSSKEQLRLRYLDNFSRVIKTYRESKLTPSEQAEIQFLQIELKNKQLLLSFTQDQSQKKLLQIQINQLQKRLDELNAKDKDSLLIKTVHWDSAPEGQR